MKSSKHVETCFVRANNDFDDKLTAFWMKNKFWTKISKNGHCELFDWQYIGQIFGGDFAKFCGLLKIYEL